MSAIDWETNAWKCLEYTSAYVAVSIHQLQVAKLMGTFLGTQIPRVHHKFPSIAGKSKFMVQYLEPLCRHVTNVCSMGIGYISLVAVSGVPRFFC